MEGKREGREGRERERESRCRERTCEKEYELMREEEGGDGVIPRAVHPQNMI